MTPLLSRLSESPCHALTYHRAWCGAVAGVVCDARGVRHVGQRIRVAEAVACSGRLGLWAVPAAVAAAVERAEWRAA